MIKSRADRAILSYTEGRKVLGIRRAKLFCGLATFALGVSALSTPAVAQDSPPEGGAQELEDTPAGVGTIVVTARKREENLQDTPISITAFSGKNLDSRGATDIADIGSFTPSLTFDTSAAISPTSSTASIYIRGIGQPDWTLPTDPGVGIYVDGVYVARSVGGVLDILEVDSIEVLKGPQGTLFGRNTIGGAISINTRKPHDDFEGRIAISAGSFDRVEVRAFLNIPITENFAMNFSGMRKKADGFIKNQIPGLPDIGDDDTWAGRAAARITPTDRLEINLAVDASRDRITSTSNIHTSIFDDSFLSLLYNGVLGPVGFNRPGISPDAVCADYSDPARFSNPTCLTSAYAAKPGNRYSTFVDITSDVTALNQIASRPVLPEANTDVFGAMGRIDFDVSDDLSLVSITSYRTVGGYWGRDEDGTPIELVTTVNDIDQEQFTQEIQLLGESAEGRLNWVLGGFYFKENGCHLDAIWLYGEAFTSGGCIEAENVAAFAQGTFDVTDRLAVTLGIRYSDDKKIFTPDTQVIDSPLFGLPTGFRLLPNTPSENSYSEVNFHGNLAYRWNENLMTYVSYSDGFKGGTFTQRVFPPLPEVPTAAPEKVQSFEVGFKSDLFGGLARLNGAGFFMKYDDIQVTVVLPGDAGLTTQNAAAGEILGFELEGSIVPTNDLTIEFGASYLDADYTEVGPATLITLDSEFVNTPKWSFQLGVANEFHLPSGWEATPRVDVNYKSRIYNDAVNTPALTQDGVALVNAGFTLKNENFGGWSFRLQGYNLTDKFVKTSGFSDPSFTGNEEVTVAPPRTWLATLQYEY